MLRFNRPLINSVVKKNFFNKVFLNENCGKVVLSSSYCIFYERNFLKNNFFEYKKKEKIRCGNDNVFIEKYGFSNLNNMTMRQKKNKLPRNNIFKKRKLPSANDKEPETANSETNNYKNERQGEDNNSSIKEAEVIRENNNNNKGEGKKEDEVNFKDAIMERLKQITSGSAFFWPSVIGIAAILYFWQLRTEQKKSNEEIHELKSTIDGLKQEHALKEAAYKNKIEEYKDFIKKNFDLGQDLKESPRNNKSKKEILKI